MKMTMHIDEKLLDSVIDEYGFESKTEAVDSALREMNRRAKLRRFMSEGLGLTEEELKESVDPDYDPMSLRVAEPTGSYGSTDSR
jgi:Arc/MetJ family transcription regulator